MSFLNLQQRSQMEYRRRIGDNFATPDHITEALLQQEQLEGLTWECACGQGFMAKVLNRHGYEVLATDLFDRGYGEGGVDFLNQTRKVENVVTNPPYYGHNKEDFLRHALKLATRKVALLLPLPFFGNMYAARMRLVFSTPLKAVYVFSPNDVYFYRDGNTDDRHTFATCVAWFVWEQGYRGDLVFKPISPPEKRPVISRLALRRTIHRQTVQSA
jgi:hypothetical protein